MTLIQLHYALTVAKYGNFTLAAKKVFVTQPTLSMQVQKLEDELGIRLFDRSKNPIVPTKIGTQILTQARIILNESARIRDLVEREKGRIGGDFTLGIIPTIAPALLPLFLKPFLKKYTQVNLHIREMQTEALIQSLNDGQIDAGIAATPLNQPGLIERPLYVEPFVGYVPENHRLAGKKRLSVKDLNIRDILLLKSGHCFRNNVVNLCDSPPTANQRTHIDSGSFETMIRLSNQGFGMTLLPYLTASELSGAEKPHLKDFAAPVPSREVSVLYSEAELKLHAIEALAETIDHVIKTLIFLEDAQVISPLEKPLSSTGRRSGGDHS